MIPAAAFARPIALALAFVLCGCADNSSRLFGSSYSSYDPTLPRYAAATGPMPVTLNGGPFSASDVAGAMNALPNLHGLTFAADGPPGRFGYRVALNFAQNPANPCSPDAGTSFPFDSDPRTLRFVAAFCRHGSLISRTAGLVPRPERADDPAFRRYMSAVVNELMPPFKPRGLEDGDCTNRPNC